MSHDFAKAKSGKAKKPKRKSNQKNVQKNTPNKKLLPGWVWFVSGVVVTLFSQFLYQLAHMDPHELPETVQSSKTDSIEKKPERSIENTPKKPKIEFYTTLKEREVKVPEERVTMREKEVYSYALQAGAFKNKDDAEQQRVEIILLGLEATVESRKNKGGSLHHRIIVGPFTSRSALASARNKLIASNIPSMKIKR